MNQTKGSKVGLPGLMTTSTVARPTCSQSTTCQITIFNCLRGGFPYSGVQKLPGDSFMIVCAAARSSIASSQKLPETAL